MWYEMFDYEDMIVVDFNSYNMTVDVCLRKRDSIYSIKGLNDRRDKEGKTGYYLIKVVTWTDWDGRLKRKDMVDKARYKLNDIGIFSSIHRVTEITSSDRRQIEYWLKLDEENYMKLKVLIKINGTYIEL